MTDRSPVAARRVRKALLATLLLAGCAGAARPPALAPPAATALASAAPERDPEAEADPLLTLAPRDAETVVLLEVAAVRTTPLGAAARTLLAELDLAPARALREACGEPLAQLDGAALVPFAGLFEATVLRGAVTTPAGNACLRAAQRVFFDLDEEPTLAAVTTPWYVLARRAGEVAARHASLSETLTASPVARALARATRGAALRALWPAHRPATTPTMGDLQPASSGLDEQTLAQLREAQLGSAFGVTLTGEGTARLTAWVLFRDEGSARVAAPGVERYARAALTALRGMLAEQTDAASRELFSEAERREAQELLDALPQGLSSRSEGPLARVDLALDAAAMQRVVAMLERSARRYERIVWQQEAAGYVEALVDHARARVAEPRPRGQRARTPLASAPRTPAEVPRGVAVDVPAAAWTSGPWASLGFSGPARTRYSYELEVRGTRVTARALGDLDGDGVYSTFERAGRVSPQGVLELDPLRVDQADE